ALVDMLRRRAPTLDGVTQGFGRSGVAGRWGNAFGSITVTPAEAGYRPPVDFHGVYGFGSDRRRECRVAAEVKSPAGPWFAGAVLPQAKSAKAGDDKSEPEKPVSIKIRRQGETLRVVLGDEEWSYEDRTE